MQGWSRSLCSVQCSSRSLLVLCLPVPSSCCSLSRRISLEWVGRQRWAFLQTGVPRSYPDDRGTPTGRLAIRAQTSQADASCSVPRWTLFGDGVP